MLIAEKFQLKTNGIPKEQLDKMGTLVKNFQIGSRMTFEAPIVGTEVAKEPEKEAQPAKNKAEKAPTPKPTQVP